jgi:6-phosphogluconolactonase
VSAPEIRRFGTPQGLADEVAATLLATLRDAQGEGRVPAVALTGGTIARTVHEALAASASGGDVDWSRVDVWFGDERYVPADDPERNAGQVAVDLLDHLPLDPARVHPMPAADGGFASLQEAAAAYAVEVRTHGSGEFDVVMLGVGPDGHVASLFPGYPQLDVDDDIAVAVTDSPKPPPLRISLTFPALNRSRQVWFLVSGDGKADAVARALATGDDAPTVREIPAVGVHGRERTVWFVDEAAASRL